MRCFLVAPKQSAETAYKAFVKSGNYGNDMLQKINYVQKIGYEAGFTQDQMRLVLGLIDHESGGTWSETAKGDQGCSIGIAQWNKCVGRIAPKTFEEQANLIVQEMARKFAEFSDLVAVSKHNAPAWDYNTNYVNRVVKSSKLFNF